MAVEYGDFDLTDATTKYDLHVDHHHRGVPSLLVRRDGKPPIEGE